MGTSGEIFPPETVSPNSASTTNPGCHPRLPNGGTAKYPAYRFTKDGFTLLAMGFTGKRALGFKLAYIAAFNRMEEALHGQAGQDAGQRLAPDEAGVQAIAFLHDHLQQQILQHIMLPALAGQCSVGQRWVVTLGPDDRGAPLVALLHALAPDAIISRALEAAPHQRRSLALAAYGSHAMPALAMRA